jgi:hypothetical protein
MGEVIVRSVLAVCRAESPSIRESWASLVAFILKKFGVPRRESST